MTVDDVLAELKPEHFRSGKVPSRTTVSERLAGIGIKDDFVQALADICSQDVNGRERLMQQFKALRDQPAASPHQSATCQDAMQSVAAELVIVQKRSLDVSDKLTRAMERVTELERERNSANHMVLLLLAMVDKLQRDITILARERDRLQTSTSQTSIHDVETRLLRSEGQRTTAESELKRAREERSRADFLAAEAAEQVRVLSEELERLRGQQPAPEVEQLSESDLQTLQEAPGDDPAGIDEALAKAAHHLDDRADRLDRLADEMSRDNLSDNPPSSTASLDNWTPDPPLPPGLFDREKGPDIDRVVQESLRDLAFASMSMGPSRFIEMLSNLRESGSDGAVDKVLRIIGRDVAPAVTPSLLVALQEAELDEDYGKLVTAVGETREPISLMLELLRKDGLTNELHEVLAAAGGQRPPSMVPVVFDGLDEDEGLWVLAAAGRRPLHELLSVIQELESAGRKREAANLNAHYWYRVGEQNVQRDSKEWNVGSQNGPGSRQPTVGEGGNPDISMPRPLPMYGLPLSTLVRAVTEERGLPSRSMGHQRVYAFCATPASISQIAHGLNMPFHHTTTLVTDLLNDGSLEALGVSE